MAKAFFERHFTPSAVVHNGPKGLLTGYYEPLLKGSRTPPGQFQTPIYKRPAELVNLIHETQRGAVGWPSPTAQDRNGHRALSPRVPQSSKARSRAKVSSSFI